MTQRMDYRLDPNHHCRLCVEHVDSGGRCDGRSAADGGPCDLFTVCREVRGEIDPYTGDMDDPELIAVSSIGNRQSKIYNGFAAGAPPTRAAFQAVLPGASVSPRRRPGAGRTRSATLAVVVIVGLLLAWAALAAGNGLQASGRRIQEKRLHEHNPVARSPKPEASVDSLLRAIRHVESAGNDHAVGDAGRSRGPYQIQRGYWRDGGGESKRYLLDVWSADACRPVILGYWRRYAPKALAAGDLETLARVHNGGPAGAKNPATADYWLRVKNQLRLQASGGRLQEQPKPEALSPKPSASSPKPVTNDGSRPRQAGEAASEMPWPTIRPAEAIEK